MHQIVEVSKADASSRRRRLRRRYDAAKRPGDARNAGVMTSRTISRVGRPPLWTGFALSAFFLILHPGPMAAADDPRPAVGDLAPDFTLESSDGESLTLSSMRGQQKVLLVFFRGTW